MKQKIKTFILSSMSIALVMSLILFPAESFYASVRGLKIWGEVVFPSLLPFFIAQELLISFGVIQFIGTFLEPFMRPLFRLSKAGSTAWILGMASGYPAGAKISATLREKQLISRNEAERLVSFSNAASPLFIFGAIAVGFFQRADLGLFIACCHYLTNALVGVLIRSYGKKEQDVKSNLIQKKGNLLMTAFYEMHETRIKDKRPFGQVLADAVVSSMQTLITIGGFIIVFSVMTTLLSTYHIFSVVAVLCTPFISILSLDNNILEAILTGLFEISLGAEMVAQQVQVTLKVQLATISFILGFNGLSIHAQVAAILANTDIRYTPYFFARLLHACLASLVTLLAYDIYYKPEDLAEVTFNHKISYSSDFIFQSFTTFGSVITIFSLFIASCIIFYRIVRAR